MRFLQDGEFYSIGGSRAVVANVRLIASTSKDLAKLVAEKKFREDLRYALSIFPITVPSLKDRGEKDIMMMAQHFCRTFSINENKKIKLINDAVTNLLGNCDWRDNVRQLKNYIFRAVVLCDTDSLEVEHFPQLLNIQFDNNKKSDLVKKRISLIADNSVEIFNELGVCKSLSDIEEEIARKLMEKFSGNISEVAKQLNIARSTLYRKLKIEEEIDG